MAASEPLIALEKRCLRPKEMNVMLLNVLGDVVVNTDGLTMIGDTATWEG